jgi:phage terminase small subunit
MAKAKKPVKRKNAGGNGVSASDRRRLFVEAYLSNNNNATQAALAAGFSPKTAGQQGSRLLKNAEIQQILDSKRAETFSNLKITRERILLERARLAFFDPRKLFDKDGRPIPIQDLDDDTAAVLCGLDVARQSSGGEDPTTTTTLKYKLADKNASLTSLERQLGMNGPEAPKDPAANDGKLDLLECARIIAFTLARATHRMDNGNPIEKVINSV